MNQPSKLPQSFAAPLSSSGASSVAPHPSVDQGGDSTFRVGDSNLDVSAPGNSTLRSKARAFLENYRPIEERIRPEYDHKQKLIRLEYKIEELEADLGDIEEDKEKLQNRISQLGNGKGTQVEVEQKTKKLDKKIELIERLKKELQTARAELDLLNAYLSPEKRKEQEELSEKNLQFRKDYEQLLEGVRKKLQAFSLRFDDSLNEIKSSLSNAPRRPDAAHSNEADESSEVEAPRTANVGNFEAYLRRNFDGAIKKYQKEKAFREIRDNFENLGPYINFKV